MALLKNINRLFSTPFNMVIFVTVCVASVVFIVLKFIPEPSTTIHITAQTETLAFRVSQPDIVHVELIGVDVEAISPNNSLFTSSPKTTCVSGELLLSKDSVVRYSRHPDSTLTVAIEEIAENFGVPQFEFSDGSNPRIPLGPGSTITIKPKNPDSCISEPPDVLPIWGTGELGSEKIAAGNYLFASTLKVFARTIRIPFVEPSPSLYLAGQFEVPSGSRIVEEEDGNRWSGQDWIGSARIPRDEKSGFLVQATTTAKALRVYRAGIEKSGYEIVQLGMFARQFKDPSLLWLQMNLGIILLIADFIIKFVGLIPTSFFSELRTHRVNPPKETTTRASHENQPS